MKSANILASVVARLVTAGNWWHWDDGWYNHGLVGAVLEDDAIAGGVVALILEEHGRVE
jgi:hypothetical protein